MFVLCDDDGEICNSQHLAGDLGLKLSLLHLDTQYELDSWLVWSHHGRMDDW